MSVKKDFYNYVSNKTNMINYDHLKLRIAVANQNDCIGLQRFYTCFDRLINVDLK